MWSKLRETVRCGLRSSRLRSDSVSSPTYVGTPPQAGAKPPAPRRNAGVVPQCYTLRLVATQMILLTYFRRRVCCLSIYVV